VLCLRPSRGWIELVPKRKNKADDLKKKLMSKDLENEKKRKKKKRKEKRSLSLCIKIEKFQLDM
jgi:hypothetical protein